LHFIAVGLSKLVSYAPKTFTAAQIGLLGVWGTSGAIGIYKTPASDRGAKISEFVGQGIGIGALYGVGYAEKRANVKIKQQNAQISQKNIRASQLENMKRYGQFSDYAKTDYKQIGTGRKLTPTLQKSIAKQFGVSRSVVREASIYRQTLNVKSPTIGTKPYKTGKWGISFSQTVGRGTTEIAGTFRVYRGKPTSWNLLKSVSAGNYAYTSKYVPQGKSYIRTDYLTRSYRVSNIKYNPSVNQANYITQTRVVPVSYRSQAIKPSALWKSLGSTYKVSNAVSSRLTIKGYNDFGGIRISDNSKYNFIGVGKGQPSLATKNIQVTSILGKAPPKTGGSSNFKWLYDQPTPRLTGGSSGGSSSGGGSSSTIQGVKTINVTEKTGPLIALKDVTDSHDLMIITQFGNILRSSVSALRVMGRATQGVRLIHLKENDIIASVACVLVNEGDEESETGESEENNINSEENGKEFDV